MGDPAWYHRAYRRNVIDMHITDDHESFMSQFDAKTYVDMLATSQVQSAVVYAHSHVGLCFYPTKVARMHRGLNGRDILSEVIDLCHQNNIAVVVYMSLIYDTWAARNNPDWCIVGQSGSASGISRYGVCCPNSPYRDYAAAIAAEICQNYDFEGIRFDMTFWPGICACRYCRDRFAHEAGGELPETIDWDNPQWVSFQRKREEWLAEFAGFVTGTVRRLKPGASVEHQASTYLASWRLGVSHTMAAANDFLQGDFYGDALQGSIARKLFYNLSPNRPGGFETSIAVDLRNYTALKPAELLECKASAALADGSAFIFIDSIDPEGTLNPTVYQRMGAIFEKTKVYDKYLGGTACQDVALYLSTESKHDPADNGRSPGDAALSTHAPHVDALVGAAGSLLGSHIPFGVLTKRSLADLARHQIVVLPNVLMMDKDEADAVRAYVRAGGCVYASGPTSLVTKDGVRQSDFLLADVFGVSYKGVTKESFTYIAPVPETAHLFAPYTARHPVGLASQQMLVDAHPDARVLGTLVLPYTDPADPIHFASIHNNPPGIATGRPAVVLNHFGAGTAMYVTADIESHEPHRGVFVNLVRMLAKSFSFAADAPKAVEITMFDQPDKHLFIVSVVNFQKDLPNIPVDGLTIRVRLEERTAQRVLLLPQESVLAHTVGDGYTSFVVPHLETFHMLAVEYS